MKLLILLIILIIALFNDNVINSQNQPTLYANFLPYQNDNCQGESIGVGLSITVGPCIENIGENIGIDNSETIEWSLFINALRVGIKQFNSSTSCNHGSFSEFYSFKNGTCTLTPPFLSSSYPILIKNGLPLNQQYSKFFITNKPFYGLIGTTTQVIEQYSSSSLSSSNKCSNENLLYLLFITNSLELQFSQPEISINYQCNNNGDAIQQICKFNQQCNNITVTTECNNQNEKIYCINN